MKRVGLQIVAAMLAGALELSSAAWGVEPLEMRASNGSPDADGAQAEQLRAYGECCWYGAQASSARAEPADCWYDRTTDTYHEYDFADTELAGNTVAKRPMAEGSCWAGHTEAAIEVVQGEDADEAATGASSDSQVILTLARTLDRVVAGLQSLSGYLRELASVQTARRHGEALER